MAQIDGSPYLSSPLFLSLPQKRVYVRRVDQSVNDDGVLVESNSHTFEIKAVVQPAGPKTLRQLSDGSQTSEMIELWSVASILAPQNGIGGDVVLWKNSSWLVRQVTTWTGWGKGFTHVVAERIGFEQEPSGIGRWGWFRWGDGTRWA